MNNQLTPTFFFFSCMVCEVLDLQPGIELMPLVLEAGKFNHWTTIEVPTPTVLYSCPFSHLVITSSSITCFLVSLPA